MLVLLSFYTTSIFYNIHIVVKIISLMIFLVLAFFRILEVLRSTNMIIENNRLIIGIDEISASVVEEIVYNSWIIYIKRKNRGAFRKYVTVSLRDNKELEQLKSKLNEFVKSNDLRIRKVV